MNESLKQPLHSKRIELVIVPGRSLGPFRLGSSLWDIINFLSDKTQFFPSVELKYSQEEPLEFDFIVALPANGLNLRFDGSLQRLKSIECYDPNKVKLVYQNNDVSSSRTIPTFLLIYKSFGPTYPGEFDSNKSIYTLKYPGLAFTFPIPTKHQTLYTSSTDLPLEFPDGTTPIASRIMLYSWQPDSPPLSKIIAESNTKLKREVENVVARPTVGITLYFPTASTDESKEVTNQTVFVGLNITTVQDLLADLGKPARIFYKEEDKMKIHSVSDKPAGPLLDSSLKTSVESNTTNAKEEEKSRDPSFVQPTDYFFNYFHLGIDILIDGALHICKKIVLHGNVPGHYDFQRYKRCPFQIIFPKDKKKKSGNPSLLVDIEEEDNENIILANMKIQTIQDLIPWDASDTNPQKPVILTRGSSEQNPFGSTHLTGYDDGIVMEVMKNGYVPTIVLF
ncbi:MAG: hypothetical protein EXX96DRAFT_548142 [Benjaminiella poitrasii]|nr:MAG: hypothetical protein EXX96DRAFT_548142 [Benjaminiella poitrasii]